MDTASQFALTNQKLAETAQRCRLSKSMENLGINVSRYGLVVTLLLTGIGNSLPVKHKAFSLWWRTAR